MKIRKIYFCAAALLLVACQHDIVRPIDFSFTLDPSNTYLAGETLRFNFEGEADNILFYSGETGHQYKYRDRYSVPMEQIESVRLDVNIKARYGDDQALEIYVTDSFEGLKGNDALSDRATVKAMVEGGMQGWTKLEWTDQKEEWKACSYGEGENGPDLKALAENFCIAFHWCPPSAERKQRTYYINGSLHTELDGTEPVDTDLKELGLLSVMLNEEIEDPYHKNKGNGSIIFNQTNNGVIVFQGVDPYVLGYALDGWVFSTPMPLNRVVNDKAVVVKNLQNYQRSFEYVFEEPGTYEVCFVVSNENYMQSESKVFSQRITILEKL